MASFFKKLKAAATIGNNDSWSNPEPRKQAPASTPSPAQVQAIRTAKFGKYANNPNAVAEFTRSNAPVQFNAVRAIPSTLKSSVIHNPITNMAGDALIKPAIRTGFAVNQGIGNAEVGIAHALGLRKDVKTEDAPTYVKNAFGNNSITKGIGYTGTKSQIAGDLITTGANVAMPGSSKLVTGAFKSVAPKVVPQVVNRAVANAGVGAVGGGISNVGTALSNDQIHSGKDVVNAVRTGAQFGAVLGGAGTLALPVVKAGARAIKPTGLTNEAMNQRGALMEAYTRSKQANKPESASIYARQIQEIDNTAKSPLQRAITPLKGNQGGYISMGKDGKPFVKVTKDQHLFDNAPPEQHQAIAQKYLNDNFKGKTIQVDGDGNIAIGNRGIGKFTSDSQRLSKETLSDKMRLSTELDNALKVSTKRSTVADRGGRHGSFAKDGFDYRSFKFEVGGKQFVGTVNVAKNGKASNFYDIHPIKELPNKSGSRLSGSPTNGDTVSPNGAPTGTIPNNVPHVNRIRGLDKLNNNQAGFIKLGKPRLTPLKNNQAGFVKVGKETDPYIKKIRQPIEKELKDAQAEMDKYGTGYINDINLAAKQAKAKARLDRAKEADWQNSESKILARQEATKKDFETLVSKQKDFAVGQAFRQKSEPWYKAREEIKSNYISKFKSADDFVADFNTNDGVIPKDLKISALSDRQYGSKDEMVQQLTDLYNQAKTNPTPVKVGKGETLSPQAQKVYDSAQNMSDAEIADTIRGLSGYENTPAYQAFKKLADERVTPDPIGKMVVGSPEWNKAVEVRRAKEVVAPKPKVTMNEGRANLVLDKKIRYKGQVMTKRDYLDALSSDGYVPQMQKVNGKTKYVMKSASGDYFDVSKIEHDLAKSKQPLGETPLAKSERLHQEKLAKNNLTQNEYAALHQKVTDLENKASDLHHNVGKAMDAEPRKADGTFANPTQPKVRKAIDDWSKALDEHLKALNAVRKIDGQDPIVLGNRSIGDKVPVIPDPTNVKIKQPNNGSKIPVRKEVVQGDTVTRTNVNPNVKAREQRFSVADDGQLLPDSKGATRVFTNEKGSVTHIRVGDEVYNLKDIGDLTNIKNYGSTVATQRRNIERAFKDNPTTGKRVNELVVDFQQEQATKMIVRQKTLQDGMKQLTDELGISFGVGRHNAKKVSAAIQDFGENKRDYDSLVKEFGKQKADTIVKADNWFRTQYDQLLDEANKELTKYGYDPIPKRDNYYTHFSEPSIWQKFGLKMQEVNDAFGSPIQEATPSGGRGSIPNTLAGQSEYMVPNKKFNRFALRRKGDEHTSNAFEAFEKYLNPTLNNIYMTPAITRARVMTKAIAMENDRVGKDANQVVVQMTEWANHLAGKSNRLGDRQAADTTGFRQALQASNWVQRKVGANSIVGNVATAIIQPIVLAQTAGKAGYKNTMLALLQEASTSHKANAAIRQSEFMRRRYTNLSPVSRGKVQRSADVASVPLKVIEETAGRITWQANYNKALEQGLKGKQAIKFADVEAEKTMAGRAIGEKPELYRSKAAGFATQFQLEVNNYVQQVGKEMTPAQVAKTFTAAYGINILLQEATGRSIGFNPIDAAVDSVEILAGDDDEKAKKVAQRWGGEIAGNVPVVSSVLDTLMSDDLTKKVFGTQTPIGRFGVGSPYSSMVDNTVGKVVKGKPLEAAAYLAAPFGYSQVNKTINGVGAVVRGEMTDKDGNTTVEVPQTAGNLVRGALFGPSAIKEVNQYYNNIGVKKEDQKPVQNQTDSKAAKMGAIGTKGTVDVKDQIKQAFSTPEGKKFLAMNEDEKKKHEYYDQYKAMQGRLGAKEADDLPESLRNTSAPAFTKKLDGFTQNGKDNWYKQTPSEKDKALYDAANAVKGKDWLDLPKSNQTIADYIAYQKKVSKATTNFEKQDAAKEFVRDTYKQYLPENARKLFSGTNYNEDQKLAAIASGELTQDDFEKALQLDNMMYEKGLSSSLSISKKIRSKYGYGTPSKSGGGSGRRSSGGRKKSNIKLSDYSVSDIYKTTSSHRKKLRDLLEQAKV